MLVMVSKWCFISHEEGHLMGAAILRSHDQVFGSLYICDPPIIDHGKKLIMAKCA